MSLLRFCFFVLLLTVILSAASAKDAEDLHWLTKAQEKALLDAETPAPAPGSAEDRADLAGVLQAQAVRTPQQVAQVVAEEKFSPALFDAAIGFDFNEKQEPKLYDLVKTALQDAGSCSQRAKAHWQRPRPFRAHPEVHPVYPADGLSYPSGHATGAYACATVLAAIFPDKKPALLAEAAQIAEDRVIGGVHYPSDIAEGEKLGKAVAELVLANPKFEAKLARAEKELSALHGG